MTDLQKSNSHSFNLVASISFKNLTNSLKQKLSSKYTVSDAPRATSRSTDINVLLNRVKSDKKQEIRKKFYFSAAASTGLILFGLIVFS